MFQPSEYLNHLRHWRKNGKAFIAMEFLLGMTLKRRIGENPIETDVLLGLAIEIAKRIGRGTKRGCRPAESCLLAQAPLQATACNLQLLDSGGAMLDRPISAARCHART